MVFTVKGIAQSLASGNGYTQTADGYASVLGTLFRINGLQFSDIEDVIISTVVPPIIPILESLSRRYFSVNPILVGPGIKTGLNILYDNPKDLGLTVSLMR